jgi:hypothetical protein
MKTIHRAVTLTRSAASALQAAGWSVREGAVHSSGTVDVAAQRRFLRGDLEAVIHLLIIVDSSEGELVFSEGEGMIEHAPIAFSLGDDDPAQRRALAAVLSADLLAHLHATAYPRERSITAPLRVDAPKARTRASFFRSSNGDAPFDRAFAALDGVHDDLMKLAIETIADDLELLSAGDAATAIDPFLRRCDLLHGIIVTDQVMRCNAVRLERSSVVGTEHRWIDVVRSEAFADFADALTRHYTARLSKRRIRAA